MRRQWVENIYINYMANVCFVIIYQKKKELNIIWFFLFSSTKVERSRWVCSLYVCIYRNDYGILHNKSESKHNSDPKRYKPTHFMQRKRSCMNEWTNNNHKHSLLAHCMYSFRWPFTGYNFFFHNEKLCPLLATNSCWLAVYILLGVFVCGAIFGFLLKIVPLSRKIIGYEASGYFRLVSLWASFRCHALVKYSPDAFSFNYTHIVVWIYFNDFEVLPWETHSDVLFFFRRLFVYSFHFNVQDFYDIWSHDQIP